MNFFFTFFIFFSISINLFAQKTSNGSLSSFSIVACPSQTTDREMNISWATSSDIKNAYIEYDIADKTSWKNSLNFRGTICKVYDSIYSKSADGKDIYENVIICKYDAQLKDLKKNKSYKYRIITDKDTSDIHYFHTCGANEWSACVISDFHVYTPAYARTEAAMKMVDKVAQHEDPIKFVLHLGDIIAWGGSYSFWKQMYREENFHKYMWAGVNGNHDDMSRGYIKTSNEFFKYANAYPLNGYKGEEGVSYFFKYGDVLFIMLNNEAMKSDEGLQNAQEWVRKVVAENPAKYKVVCEHYQWFYGQDGKDSQYARWSKLFDELGISLALGANNHIYMSTHPIYDGKVVADGKGTVYIQNPSSDNERGADYNRDEDLKYNADKIKFRWSEGDNTVGALHLNVNKKRMTLKLLDREGNVLDTTFVYPQK